MMPSGPFQQKKLTGTKCEGIAFQRRVHRELLEPLGRFGPVYEEQWFRFSDTYGTHWCQPDGLVEFHDRVLVVEAKRSLRGQDSGMRQLRSLYRPVVELALKKPTVLCLAFHHWTAHEPEFEEIDSIEDLISLPLGQCDKVKGLHVL
jgi:hypothetical protein